MKKLVFGLIATVMFSFVGNAQDLAFNNEKTNYSINEMEKTSDNIQNNYSAFGEFSSTSPINAEGAGVAILKPLVGCRLR